MKKLLSVLLGSTLFASVISMSSCKKEDIYVFVDVPAQSICFPASAFISGAGEPYTFEVPISSVEAAFVAAGATFSVDKVVDAEVKDFKATMSSGNFDYISGMQVYAKGATGTGDGSQVSYVDNTGTGVSTLNFTPNGTDVSAFLSGDKVVFTVRTFNNANNTPETCFSLNSGKIVITASPK